MYKPLKLFLLLLSVLTCASCQQFSPDSNEAVQLDAADLNQNDALEPLNLEWLEYADAKAEANFAIQKKDFHLLAFNAKGISVPGIKLDFISLDELEKHCGLKILANSGDEIQSQAALNWRKKLFSYAEQYNQIVFSACRD